MKHYLIILYLIATVALGGVADGLNTRIQTWGHLLEAIEVLALFSFIFVFKLFTLKQFLYALGAYVCIRIAGFDLLYNWAAGNVWYYFSGANLWDAFWIKQAPGGILWMRGVSLTLGITFAFHHLISFNRILRYFNLRT